MSIGSSLSKTISNSDELKFPVFKYTTISHPRLYSCNRIFGLRPQSWSEIWKDKPKSPKELFPLSGIPRTRWSEQGTGVPACVPIGLRIYPSSESEIPPQMGRTHFPPWRRLRSQSSPVIFVYFNIHILIYMCSN